MHEVDTWLVQAKNPKDQYLLLKALNEVIVSISSGSTGKQLSLTHQQEVCSLLSCYVYLHLAPPRLSARTMTSLSDAPVCLCKPCQDVLLAVMGFVILSDCLHRC